MDKTNIYIIERLGLYRAGIRFVLSNEEDFQIIGETSSSEFAINYLEQAFPDVVIFSIESEKSKELDMVYHIKSNYPSISLIVTAIEKDPRTQFRALTYGADEIIPLNISSQELVDVVRKVASGDRTISDLLLDPQVAALVYEEFKSYDTYKHARELLIHLNQTEEQILNLTSQGMSPDQVLVEAGITEETRKRHLEQIRSKLIINYQRSDLIRKIEGSPVEEPQLPEQQAAESVESDIPEYQEITPGVEEPAINNGHKTVPENNRKNASQELIVPTTGREGNNHSPKATSVKIWRNPRIIKLIELLTFENITTIEPEISLSAKDGFVFPEVDEVLDTTGEATVFVLDSLVDDGILKKKSFERVLLSPKGSMQILPVETCPFCNSSDIVNEKILEHFPCGYVGSESDFLANSHYTCPKCKQDLKLLGTDYRSLGLLYSCQSCHELFPVPEIKYRSLETGKLYHRSELREIKLNSYKLDDSKRDWLEFQLKPKIKFINYLKDSGYEVEEQAEIAGKSGAIHTIDILASRGKTVPRYLIGIGILSAMAENNAVTVDQLLKLNAVFEEVEIQNKAVIVIPSIVPEARKFAEAHEIRVLAIDDLLLFTPDSGVDFFQYQPNY